MRNYTQEIYSNECVGDSLGKHNYNILNLEKKLSKFTYLKNLSPELLLDIDSKITYLNSVKESFINNKRLSRAISTVKILEKFWKNKNIHVNFPINLSDSWNDSEIRCITKSEDFNDIVLKLKKILYLKYHPSAYPENTKIHFAVPIYNTQVGTPDRDYKISAENQSSNLVIEVSNPFSYENRTQSVKLFKKGHHISQIQTFVFQNFHNKRWSLINHIYAERFEEFSKTVTNTIQFSLQNTIYNFDLYDYIITNYPSTYVPGNTIIKVNIEPDTLIGSTSNLKPSFIIKNFNYNDEIIINNYGRIYGAGGTGESGQNAHSSPLSPLYTDYRPEAIDGGTALFAGCKITLFNYGKIYSGGGGGAGGVVADSVVPPMTALSVFNPELDDLWCCYKYDIAKARYELDLANGVIEYEAQPNEFISPVAAYSSGGAGGGGQGLIGGLPGRQGSLSLNNPIQLFPAGATEGTVDSPGAGGLGSVRVNLLSPFKPDIGGSGGEFGQDGKQSAASSSIGGFAGFAIAGFDNVIMSSRGDIKGYTI